MTARHTRTLTLMAALVVGGGLLKLATDDEPVEVQMPELHVLHSGIAPAVTSPTFARVAVRRPGW